MLTRGEKEVSLSCAVEVWRGVHCCAVEREVVHRLECGDLLDAPVVEAVIKGQERRMISSRTFLLAVEL